VRIVGARATQATQTSWLKDPPPLARLAELKVDRGSCAGCPTLYIGVDVIVMDESAAAELAKKQKAAQAQEAKKYEMEL
jgi:hypothetical protein